jgi:hypothetical protein
MFPYDFFYRFDANGYISEAACLNRYNKDGHQTSVYDSYVNRPGGLKDTQSENEAIEDLCTILFDTFASGNVLMSFLESIASVAVIHDKHMQSLGPILRAANRAHRFNVMTIDKIYPHKRGDNLSSKINKLMPSR